MNYEYELMHYGVKGMKWGVRKKHDPVQTSDIRRKYDDAKAAKKTAKKAFNKSYNNAYRLSENGFANLVSKNHRAKRDAAWDDTYDKLDALDKAKADYKTAKKERSKAIQKTYKDIDSKASIGNRLTYNNATRKKAAQYVVDNNMSVAEATKKAQGEAWRNTAIFVAGYGAIAAATIYSMK